MTGERKIVTIYIVCLIIVSVIVAGVLAYGHHDRRNKIDAFVKAVAGNDVDHAQALVRKDRWLINTCPGKSDRTPLFWARTKEMTELLVAAGADLERKDKYGRTPLLRSIVKAPQGNTSNGSVTEILITAGADVNARDNDGITPLLMAAYYGDMEAIVVLLSHRADANAGDNQGNTPLRYARDICDSAMADLLRRHGAKEE